MPEGEVSQLQNTPNEDYWADSNENLDLETSGGFRNDPRRAEANIASRSVKSGARITIAPLLSNVKSRYNPLLGSPTDLEQSALHPVYPQTKPVSIRDWGCLAFTGTNHGSRMEVRAEAASAIIIDIILLKRIFLIFRISDHSRLCG